MSLHEQQERKGKAKAPADRKAIGNASWDIHLVLRVEGQDEPVAEADLTFAETYLAQSADNTALCITGRMNEIAAKYLAPKKKRK